jgi:hypothetical protein
MDNVERIVNELNFYINAIVSDFLARNTKNFEWVETHLILCLSTSSTELKTLFLFEEEISRKEFIFEHQRNSFLANVAKKY